LRHLVHRQLSRSLPPVAIAQNPMPGATEKAFIGKTLLKAFTAPSVVDSCFPQLIN
jgi:hypothetical protein